MQIESVKKDSQTENQGKDTRVSGGQTGSLIRGVKEIKGEENQEGNDQELIVFPARFEVKVDEVNGEKTYQKN